jgi:hypothetical protein
MLKKSQHLGRLLRAEEKAILAVLLGTSIEIINERLKDSVVEDMTNGGMGSIRFKQQLGESRSFGKAVAEAEYVDVDGVTVSITVNVDDRGNLYEVDFWKVDFSLLLEYPKTEQLLMR